MDFVIEQLYKRKKTVKTAVLQVLTIVAILLLGTASIIGFRMAIPGALGALIGALLAFAIIYFGYKKVLINFNVEFEYTYLSGEIDIDKIVSQTMRSRLITINAKNFEQFGPYSESVREKLSHRQFDCKVDVTSNTNATVYYAVLKHPTKGLTLVLFEPEERILEDLKKYTRHLQVR